MQRCSVLHMPTRPSVPEIMPAEVFNSRILQSLVPSLGADLRNRATLVAEYVRLMLAYAPELAIRRYIAHNNDCIKCLRMIFSIPSLELH